MAQPKTPRASCYGKSHCSVGVPGHSTRTRAQHSVWGWFGVGFLYPYLVPMGACLGCKRGCGAVWKSVWG